MSFSYTVIISEAQPTTNTPGIFWIKPSLSEFKVRTGNWALITSGTVPITVFTAGTYSKTLIIQEATPSADLGQIWLRDSTQQLYIYLNDWIPY